VFTNSDLLAQMLRPMVRALLRLTLGGRQARLILQNPDDVKLFAQERLVNATAIRLIPGSGVNCERFRPDEARKRGARLRVLLPARLLWDKGVGEFVAAARSLLGKGRAID